MLETENPARPVSAVLACALALAGCGASSHREDEGERASAERADRAPVEPMEWPPVTAEQLEVFARLLSRGYRFELLPLRQLSSAVRIGPIVLHGELVSVDWGRKEFIPGTEVYSSYVNLGVRPQHVWKGSLPEPEGDVFVEREWPNDGPLDELRRAAPLGARIIVFGELVPDARDLSEVTEVEENLLRVLPYGLMLETPDGGVILPLARSQREHAKFVEGSTFDGVIEMIETAIREL